MILDNIIFIHPPRCSGTSIEKSFNWRNEAEKHLKASQIKQIVGSTKWEDSFKFSIVRNPFDRVISIYHAPCYKSLRRGILFETLESFLLRGIPIPPNEYGVECSDYIDEKIDFIIQFENRKEDISKLNEQLNIKIDPDIWIRKLNREKNYKKYHTELSIELVKKQFSQDIKNFNYDF